MVPPAEMHSKSQSCVLHNITLSENIGKRGQPG